VGAANKRGRCFSFVVGLYFCLARSVCLHQTRAWDVESSLVCGLNVPRGPLIQKKFPTPVSLSSCFDTLQYVTIVLTSVVTFYDNSTGSDRITPLLCLPSSSTNSNRKSAIKNPNNRRVFNPFHFSNREYFAVFRDPLPSSSPSPDLIVTPRLKSLINHTVSAISNFSNRYKTRLLCPGRVSGKASFPCRILASISPCLRASVANLCDNGWLN
jgi:hypothetical protein